MAADARLRTWAKFVPVIFMGLLLVSGLLALFGIGDYTGATSNDADRQWGLVAMGIASALASGSLASIVFLFNHKLRVWISAFVLMALSFLGCGPLMLASINQVNSHRAPGHQIDMLVFGFLLPGFLGLLTLGGAACVWSIRSWAGRFEGISTANTL